MNYLTEFYRKQLGGWKKKAISSITATVQTVTSKGSKFGGYYYTNPNTSFSYIQVFDKAASSDVTLGTTVPDMIFGVPANGAANIEFNRGVNMDLGIQLAATTTPTGSSAPSSNLSLNIYFDDL